ncbi:MAG: mercury transporter [Bdellovibrio sp.]|nr:MAG: mercury transporter [Bdellovibrio sp.]
MEPIENKSKWFVGGGILAAFTASLCCVGPLILTLLGVSGAAALSKLDVLRIPMILVVATLFGVSGYLLYKKKKVCEPGSICADPKKYRKMIVAYWAGLLVAILGITSPYWIPILFS